MSRSIEMKRILILASLLLCAAGSATAQTEGRVSAGGSILFLRPTDSEVGSVVGAGVNARLNPKKGWGGAAAFNWFTADIDNPSGATGSFARLRILPVMAGAAYTIGSQPVLVSIGAVAGPSFNKITLEHGFLRTLPAGARAVIGTSTSFAVRPGVGVTWTVAPRIGILGFGGYMFNRPDILYRDVSGREFRDRWDADSVVLSVAAVYSFF